jgi:hypothetical protein
MEITPEFSPEAGRQFFRKPLFLIVWVSHFTPAYPPTSLKIADHLLSAISKNQEQN